MHVQKSNLDAVTDPRAQRILTAFRLADFPSLNEEITGGLLGLLVGVKPAVLFLSEESDACAAWARDIAPLGFDVVVEGHLIADPRQLAARAEREPLFAAWIGWNKQRTVRENILQILARNLVDATIDASDGFLLGYPECAVRQMDRYYKLARRGIVGIGMLDEEEIPNPEDRQIYRTLLERLFQSDASPEDHDHVLTEVYASDECRRFFRRFFPQATDEDYAILANGRACVILGPWGSEIYSFAIHANDLYQTEHLALQARVNEGFTNHGFGSYLTHK